MFERFTDRARRVLVLAQEEARLLNHNFIGTEHLLLGVMVGGDGVAAEALTSFDLDLPTIRQMVVETVGPSGHENLGSPPFTPRSKKVLELSLRNALQLGHNYIGTEHILLGLIQEGQGVACQILMNLDVDPEAVRRRVLGLLGDTDEEGRLSHRPEIPPELRIEEVGPPASMPRSVESMIVACSFCGSTPPTSGQMISGNNAFICERCVRRWWLRLRNDPTQFAHFPLVQHQRVDLTGLQDVRQGLQPDDPSAARAEIEAAFGASGTSSEDGQSAPFVEKGGNLGPTLAEAGARNPGVTATFSIDELVFVDREHAAVLYTLRTNTGFTLSRQRGDAVIEDGTWKMARSTFCRLLGLGGVECPPEDRNDDG